MARRDSRRVRRNSKDGNITAATHYIELTKAMQGNLHSFHLKYGASLAATFVFETSLFDEVAIDSTTAGDWYTETDVTVTAAASSASGKVYHVGNIGAVRARLVATVTNAGALDIAIAEKD